MHEMSHIGGMLVETVRIAGGVVENLPLHMDRMRRSSLELWDREVVAGPDVFNVPDGFRNGTVKCRILYGADGIASVQYSSYVPRTVRTLRPVFCDSMDYHLKYEDRSGLENLFARRDGCDDIIVVRGDGSLTDTSFGNIVVKMEDGFFTPSDFLLDGCRRRSLIASGRVRVRKIKLHDICPEHEIHIVNAMLDLGEQPPAHIVR